ncbi:MAG: 1,2-phenylacetyl-CoA epoxidase subunit PaaE, partial [Aeromicrobium sp.]
LTDDAVSITFDVPDDLRDTFTFTPGQHLTIRTELAGDDVRRNYSLCTAPDPGSLSIGVKRLHGGAFSEHALSVLKVGDLLEVMPPTGRFGLVVDPNAARHIGLVAAGSGITPLLSIASAVLEGEPDSSVTLIYANRSQNSVMFLEQIEDLKDRFVGRLNLIHVLSRQPMDADILSGRLDGDRLQRILEQLVPAPTVDEWYLCGPLDMVGELTKTLTAAGATHVHTELFHVEDVAPTRRPPEQFDQGGPVVTATLDGKTATIELTPEDDSVLAGLLRVRPDAPFACRGGVCGTCRAKVLGGAVDMRQNYALEPEEVAAGYVLTCQSWPTSEALAVSYE